MDVSLQVARVVGSRMSGLQDNRLMLVLNKECLGCCDFVRCDADLDGAGRPPPAHGQSPAHRADAAAHQRLVGVHQVAHDDVHHGVLHQREEHKHRAGVHEHVHRLRAHGARQLYRIQRFRREKWFLLLQAALLGILIIRNYKAHRKVFIMHAYMYMSSSVLFSVHNWVRSTYSKTSATSESFWVVWPFENERTSFNGAEGF